MSYMIEAKEGGHIIYIVYEQTFTLEEHLDDLIIELWAYFDILEKPVFLLSDIRSLRIDLADLPAVFQRIAGHENSVLRHDKLEEIIIVVENIDLRRAAKSLSQATYGNLISVIFDDRIAAFEYARQHIRQSA